MEGERPERLCRLAFAVGRAEFCTDAVCPFWEPGGAALEGRCAFEEVALSSRPTLAGSLLLLRSQLQAARTPAERREASGQFALALDQIRRE
jgi:hypothetical protein